MLSLSPAGIVFLFSRKNTVVPGSVRVTSLNLVSDLNIAECLIFRIDFIFVNNCRKKVNSYQFEFTFG